MNYAFPTLYENNRYWKILISIDKNGKGYIWTQHGKTGGKEIVSPPREIKYKKQPTPQEMYKKIYQLAETKWKNKQKLGFSKTKANILQESTNQHIIPMRTQDFRKQSGKIIYPAYIQVKYDGYRALTNLKKCPMISRQGKSLQNIQHLQKEIQKMGIHPNIYLDGELFLPTGIHQLKSLLSKPQSSKATDIKYYVFDMVDKNNMDMTFEERWKRLTDLFKKHKFKYLQLAETHQVKSKKEVEQYLQKFLKEGHEGLVVRNKNGVYKPKSRSMNVQKLIETKRGIFEIVGFKEGAGKQVVWEIKCQKSPRTFWAIPMGTHEYREELLKNAKKYIGEKVQVKYFGIDLEGCVTRNPIVVMK